MGKASKQWVRLQLAKQAKKFVPQTLFWAAVGAGASGIAGLFVWIARLHKLW